MAAYSVFDPAIIIDPEVAMLIGVPVGTRWIGNPLTEPTPI